MKVPDGYQAAGPSSTRFTEEHVDRRNGPNDGIGATNGGFPERYLAGHLLDRLGVTGFVPASVAMRSGMSLIRATQHQHSPGDPMLVHPPPPGWLIPRADPASACAMS
jgi:hypothetical protein